MNPRITRRVVPIAFTFAILTLTRTPAQEQRKPEHRHYDVIDLGAFGGPSSIVPSVPIYPVLNNQGIVVGVADTSVPSPNCANPFAIDCMQTYGFKWQDGALTKLKPLRGGSNSAAFYINEFGWIVGGSDNGRIDPLTGLTEQRAVLYAPWAAIIDLGTLGGASSFGNAVNDFEQVVGGALNDIPDLYTSSVFVPGATQLHAFLWQNGTIRDLKTLGGTDSFAFYINDRGQVAGVSLTNSVVNPTTGYPTLDPFLWENGTMKDLGTFGGLSGGVAGLNNNGQVAGNSNLPGDQDSLGFLWSQGILTPIPPLGGTFSVAISMNEAGAVVGFAAYPGDQNGDAFLWKNDVITDLGRFGNDQCSVSMSINGQEQIVGVSTDCFETERAVLWEKREPIVDLNTLIPSNSGLYLHEADFINDRGEITGQAILSNGDQHVFLLIPCDENHPSIEGCDYSVVEAATTAQIESRRNTQLSTNAAKLSSAEIMTRFGFKMSSRYGRFRPLP